MPTDCCWAFWPQVCSKLPANWEQPGAVYGSLALKALTGYIYQSTDRDRPAILTKITNIFYFTVHYQVKAMRRLKFLILRNWPLFVLTCVQQGDQDERRSITNIFVRGKYLLIFLMMICPAGTGHGCNMLKLPACVLGWSCMNYLPFQLIFDTRKYYQQRFLGLEPLFVWCQAHSLINPLMLH